MKASHPILIIQEKGAFLGQGKALIFIIEPLKLKNQLIEERFFKCQIGSYPFPDNQPELVTIKKKSHMEIKC
jgi:hypothetical protein